MNLFNSNPSLVDVIKDTGRLAKKLKCVFNYHFIYSSSKDSVDETFIGSAHLGPSQDDSSGCVILPTKLLMTTL